MIALNFKLLKSYQTPIDDRIWSQLIYSQELFN